MEEKTAAFHTAINAVQALGRGFDVNYDTRLLYCKGVAGSRVVEIDEEHKRDLCLYDNIVLPNVSRDINNFQEQGGRDGSSVCNYNEDELFAKVDLYLDLGESKVQVVIQLKKNVELCGVCEAILKEQLQRVVR
ncbi:MACPF domain-containing protein CAD1 [Capsicum baccatum]|uniref:MACPF domain-containing protein CAD1 n=1 Tax=Capsicum baccatum TaxID=33114 RepID=A0A2G2VU32_CAPBA|nr:MACPF domain-containing protein CAD1 [Capsicum baccatum]